MGVAADQMHEPGINQLARAGARARAEPTVEGRGRNLDERTRIDEGCDLSEVGQDSGFRSGCAMTGFLHNELTRLTISLNGGGQSQ